MRIGIMCLASCGGSARIATELAIKLAQRGHKVHLFSRTTPFSSKTSAPGITLHTVMPKREANIHPASLHLDWSADDFDTFLGRILDVITTEGLDILHFHYAVPFAFLAEEVKRCLGKSTPQLVGTLHGTDVSIHGRAPATGPRLAKTLRGMDALTTVSANHAHLSAKVFNLPDLPQIIPNFVDLDRFKPQNVSSKVEARKLALRVSEQIIGSPNYLVPTPLPVTELESLQKYRDNQSKPFSPPRPFGFLKPERSLLQVIEKSRRKPRLVHVSNFRPVKDTQSMARIFLSIREQMEAELWLIGEGPEMGAVKSILQRSGFEDDVRYWGLQPSVAPILTQTDLLLMTSLSESFCLAALEAMACGVPVLSTNVGGVPEVVKHGKTGFLFPIGGQQAAVRMAVGLLSNPTQHQTMQQAAIEHASLFGHNQIVLTYEDLYRRLLYPRLNKNMTFHIYCRGYTPISGRT